MSDDKTMTGEQKKSDAPASTDEEIKDVSVFDFYCEDNSPPLFDPFGVVLSVLVASMIFALLWMTQ